MSYIQSKINRQEEKQAIETDSQVIQMLKYTDLDFKVTTSIFKKTEAKGE
jgi:hypothetical protein